MEAQLLVAASPPWAGPSRRENIALERQASTCGTSGSERTERSTRTGRWCDPSVLMARFASRSSRSSETWTHVDARGRRRSRTASQADGASRTCSSRPPRPMIRLPRSISRVSRWKEPPVHTARLAPPRGSHQGAHLRLDELRELQSADVVLPTTDGRLLKVRCVTLGWLALPPEGSA